MVEQRGRQRHPAALAAGEAADHLILLPAEVDLVDRLLDPVGSDGGCLGHVADPRPELGRPRGPSENRHFAGFDDLDADDCPDERRLPRSARAQQPGHRAGGNVERESVEDDLPAAANTEVADLDRCARHRRAAYAYASAVSLRYARRARTVSTSDQPTTTSQPVLPQP
jgi:hypothetical protein